MVGLAWVASTTAGHTKRVTTNAIVMIGYGVGNAAGPQYWKAKYEPRDHVPWTILAVSWAVSATLLLVTRWHLARENAKRDRETRDETYDAVYITEVGADGKVFDAKVDKVRLATDLIANAGSLVWLGLLQAFLDLTDYENRDFRYAL